LRVGGLQPAQRLACRRQLLDLGEALEHLQRCCPAQPLGIELANRPLQQVHRLLDHCEHTFD
jgi:hypothetical protein